MFDLETAIADWKCSLGTRESLSADNVAELETHLRDSIAALRKTSLSPEETFLIARRRVGPATALGDEFAKKNLTAIWVRRLKWMCIGILAYLVYGSWSTSIHNTIAVRLDPTAPYQFMLLSATISPLFFGAVLLLAMLVSTRTPRWFEMACGRVTRVRCSVLLSFAVILAVLPRLALVVSELLFDFSPNARPTFGVLFLGITLMPPLFLALATYILHRRERASETA